MGSARTVEGVVLRSASAAGFTVTARSGARELARATTGADGRFELLWETGDVALGLVHVACFAAWGSCIGEATIGEEPLDTALAFRAPEESIASAVPELEPLDGAAPPAVTEAAVERFYAAVSRAERKGSFKRRFGPVEATGWIHIFENEVEQLARSAGQLVRGNASVAGQLRGMLAKAPTLLRAGAGGPHREGGEVTRLLPPRPVDVVAAGRLLGGDHAARAAGLLASRVDALDRALEAADRFDRGEIRAAQFEKLVVAAGPQPVGHHGAAAAHSEVPGTIAVDDLSPACRQLGHCLSVLLEVGQAVLSDRDVPAEVRAVEPATVCEGFGEPLRLDAGPGARHVDLWDGAKRTLLEVVEEGGDAVDVKPEEPLAAGAMGFPWQPPAASLRERLIDAAVAADKACRPFVTQPPDPLPVPPPPVRLTVSGRPDLRFTADGVERSLEATAGAAVALAWEPRTGSGTGVTTELRADGELVAEGGATGRFVVRAHTGRTYTLSASTTAEGGDCGATESTVRVRRTGGLAVAVTDRVHRPGEPLAVTVRLAHPSARGDVRVRLRSSDPGLVDDATVLVPAGEALATAYVRAGAKEGDVRISAAFDDGGDDGGDDDGPRIEVKVGRTSCTDPRHGGSWQSPTITATEPGDPCAAATTLSNGGSDQLGFAGARLTDAGSAIATIPDCWARVAECGSTEAAEQAACDAAHAQRVTTCTVTCTAFTNCDSIQCTGFANCDSIQCTSFTNCDDFWAIDPRRYACWAARGVCVAAAAVARAACWVARAACIAAAAVARAACVVARAACVAAAAVATAACTAGSAVLLGVCKAAAWAKAAACRVGAAIAAAACVVVKVVTAIVMFVVALVHIAIGIVLNTAAEIVRAGCGVGRFVGGLLGIGGTPAPRTSTGLRVVGIHVAVLHTGKVLIFSYDEGTFPVTADHPANPAAVGDSDRALCVLYDPADSTARYIPLARNLFCSGHAFTADGELLVAGGQFRLPGLLKSLIPPRPLAPGADKDIHLFDPATEVWRRLPDMEKGRWYPTVVTMPDGRVMIASGTDAIATAAGFDGGIQHTWKILDPATEAMTPDLSFNGQPIFHNYPFMGTLSSGEMFIHYKRITKFFNRRGGWRLMASAAGPPGTPERTQYEFSRTGPGPGSWCLLPFRARRDGDGFSYTPDRILILGGGGAEGTPEPPVAGEVYALGPTTPATRTSEILDFAERPLRWRFTGRSPLHPGPTTRDSSPMRFPRVMPDPVLLPDGTVLVVNGAQVGQSGGFLSHLRTAGGGAPMGASDPALAPERFDPELETWEELCPKRVRRLYHATAVLLADGRVLTAGHDGFLNMPPSDASQYQLELYSPPYLHRGPRPSISSAPDRVAWGSTFTIGTPDAPKVASACLIRQSSTTHQTNTDQRYVELGLEPAGDDELLAHAPPDGGVAPPGFYMLFVLDDGGVPSVARWVQIGPGQ